MDGLHPLIAFDRFVPRKRHSRPRLNTKAPALVESEIMPELVVVGKMVLGGVGKGREEKREVVAKKGPGWVSKM